VTINRLVWPTHDLLVCTCGKTHKVDPLHHVALNLVEHRCDDNEWTIPPRPVRNKKVRA
jgi:hypothetical protein